MIHIRNPHSVLAALNERPQDVSEIILPAAMAGGGRSSLGDAWDQVLSLARQHGIRITAGVSGPKGGKPGREGRDHRDRDRRDNRETASDAQEGGRVGVAEALVREREGVSAEELFSGARERSGGHGLWLALDCLTDPHNVGAIFRSAAFFGVQGILMTQERSAPLSGTVYDVASGGVEHVPFTIQPNLQRAFEKAKDAGLWILGTSEHANDDLSAIQKDRPWLLVIGNEEKGMRRLTEESCDVLCRISPKGGVTSLNASVAAGICIAQLS